MYVGSKVDMSAHLASRLPAHRTYVEPFGGSAAMLFAKQPSEREIVSDACYWVVSAHRAVRDNPDGLLARLPANGKIYQGEWNAMKRRIVNDWRSTEIEDAATFMICCSGAFGGGVNLRSGYSYTNGIGQFILSAPSSHPSFRKPKLKLSMSRMSACSARLRGVEIIEHDALNLIEAMRSDPQSFLFIDPPYLPMDSGGSRKADYYLNDCSHSDLMDAMRGMQSNAILTIGSGDSWYWQDFFADEGWTLAFQRSGKRGRNAKRRGNHDVWLSHTLIRRLL